jgi:uncharacterized membrane protein YvlD (DUF360 family)
VIYLRRIGAYYRTQIELLWRWRAGPRALIRRAIVSFIVALVALVLTAWLLPGLITIANWWTAAAAVLFLAAINLLVRPVLLGLVASRSVILLGVLTLLFQVVAILLLNRYVPGVTLGRSVGQGGFIEATIVSFVFAFINTALSAAFSLSEDESYYGALVRALASRRADVIHSDEPGLVILQADGTSHDVISHSVRAGRVPTMARWLRDGSHKLGHWNALLPSTTPASQAGILHGNNDGIPNFRWYEKETGLLLVANHPEDATEIERRISNGEGLLSPGGASIGNLFTGDATRSFICMSTIRVKEKGLGDSEAFKWFFVSPYNYLNMIGRFLAEVIKENIQSRRQSRAGIVPRMHRGFPYPWVRAATNVALRAMGTSLVVQEMLRGTPVIYLDYTDYDEIAHHSGPERPESLDALDGVDREIATLEKTAADAPRPYRFVVLADHGQSLGRTFLQRYGVTLQEVVRSLMGGEASVAAATAQVEDWGQMNAFLTEVTQAKGFTGALARAATRGNQKDGVVDFGPSDAQLEVAGASPAEARPVDAKQMSSSDADAAAAPAELVVVAGGNLALIYFTARKTRLMLEDIAERYPDLVEALANHPGIGVLMVRSAEHGLICVGKQGIHYLDEDRVEGVDPLAVYGEFAPASFRRLDAIEHVGDVAVVSLYDPETGEIAAFEELIGAHGGLGGPQTRPFMLYPADWELDLAPLVGAPMVYQQLRRWMEGELGFHFGPAAASDVGSPADVPTANADVKAAYAEGA